MDRDGKGPARRARLSCRWPAARRTSLTTWCILTLTGAGAIMMPSQLAVSTARANAMLADMTGFAVFSNEQVNVGSRVTVTGGLIGGNGSINVGQAAMTWGVRVAGRLQDTSMASYHGDIIANGPVDIGSRTVVEGSIHTSDRAFFSDATVRGSIYASGAVTLGDRMTIEGDVHSRGVITGGARAVVSGAVESRLPYAGAATVRGGVHDPKASPPGGSPRAPVSYSPIALPAPTSFVFGMSGDRSCAGESTLELPPGYYGEVRVAPRGELRLTTGTYYLRRLAMGDGARLQFELSSGSVLLYVNEDVVLGAKLRVTINESPVTEAIVAARTGDMTLADQARAIVMETHGSFGLGDDGMWAGAVFAPHGRIEIGANTQVVGVLLAGGTVELRDGSVLLFEPGTSLVGSPSAE